MGPASSTRRRRRRPTCCWTRWSRTSARSSTISALEGQRRFRGLMAGYLHLFNRLLYVGSTLKDAFPFATRTPEKVGPAAAGVGPGTFTAACSESRGNRQLDARQGAGQPPAGRGRSARVSARRILEPGGGAGEARLAAALHASAQRSAASGRAAVDAAKRCPRSLFKECSAF